MGHFADGFSFLFLNLWNMFSTIIIKNIQGKNLEKKDVILGGENIEKNKKNGTVGLES